MDVNRRLCCFKVLGHLCFRLKSFGKVHFGKVVTKVLPSLVFVCIKLNLASTLTKLIPRTKD